MMPLWILNDLKQKVFAKALRLNMEVSSLSLHSPFCRYLAFLISVEMPGYIGRTGFEVGFTLVVAENTRTLISSRHKQCVILVPERW